MHKKVSTLADFNVSLSTNTQTSRQTLQLMSRLNGSDEKHIVDETKEHVAAQCAVLCTNCKLHTIYGSQNALKLLNCNHNHMLTQLTVNLCRSLQQECFASFLATV